MCEFITIQVGQCGNQIGSTFWPLMLQEYGIKNVPGGITRNNTSTAKESRMNDSFYSFFSANEDFNLDEVKQFSDLQNVKARAVLIDMEDSVVARYHNGPLKNMFAKSCTIKNYPGSGNNWAEGYFTHGTEYQDIIENILRRTVEKCNNLLGFLLMYSVGGGTGSGLGSFVLQFLEEQFPNVDRFVTCVYANGSEDVITCPYNMALATKCLTDNATCVFPVENRALLEIVKRQKSQKQCTDTVNYIIECKPFQDMNTIIVNMLLHLTSGSRFAGSMNVDMNDISTNLVPLPKVQYISSSISPLTVSVDHYIHQKNSRKILHEIFNDCCHRKNQLLQMNPISRNSVLLGASLIGRGGFTVSDMRDYVEDIQKHARFTPWSQHAIKIGLCNVPPIGQDASMLTLFNTTAMTSLFDDVLQQFNKLYLKKAHVHHYTKIDGFEMDYFSDCRESLLSSIESYNSLNNVKEIHRPRYQVL